MISLTDAFGPPWPVTRDGPAPAIPLVAFRYAYRYVGTARVGEEHSDELLISDWQFQAPPLRFLHAEGPREPGQPSRFELWAPTAERVA